MTAGKIDVERWLRVNAKAVATTRSPRHVQSVIEGMQAAIRELSTEAREMALWRAEAELASRPSVAPIVRQAMAMMKARVSMQLAGAPKPAEHPGR